MYYKSVKYLILAAIALFLGLQSCQSVPKQDSETQTSAKQLEGLRFLSPTDTFIVTTPSWSHTIEKAWSGCAAHSTATGMAEFVSHTQCDTLGTNLRWTTVSIVCNGTIYNDIPCLVLPQEIAADVLVKKGVWFQSPEGTPFWALMSVNLRAGHEYRE